VASRRKKLSKKYHGTSHVLSKDEAKFVFENGREQQILGSGGMGNVHLLPEAEADFCEKGLHGPVAADPQGDSYVQQLEGEEDRPFSRYLLNRTGRDCAAADERKPKSASIGRTLMVADRRRKLPSSRSARGPDRAEPHVRTDVSSAGRARAGLWVNNLAKVSKCPATNFR
jgi:hypothetical protein